MKRSSNEVVAEVVMSKNHLDGAVNFEHMECRDIQISCIAAKSLAGPPEACRPKEGLKSKAPKHLEVLGRAVRRAPHREAFVPDVKSWGGLPSWRR
jgi:hypothetical protein